MNDNVPSEIIASIQAKYDWMKQLGYAIGDPAEPGIYRTLDGGWQCNYGNWCAIVIRPGETEPREIHGAIGQRWYREWGAFDISGKRGSLGHPLSDEEVYDGDGDPNDRISHFENGDIIWTAKTDETRIVNIKDRTRWYKAKHDQLLDLLRRAVEAPAPERHNEALKAVDAKCKEDQFDVVLLGEFQYGKSTTLDTLCGGREMSPQGEGTTPTSAVPVSIQSLGSDEPEEWGEIRFKSKRELASELFDTFEGELSQEESSHPLKAHIVQGDGSIRDRFCDGFDFDNQEHLAAARAALQDAWARYGESGNSKFAFSSRQRQLMEVMTLVVRFYDTDDYRKMLETTRLGVGDIGGYVWFPSDWSQGASRGFGYEVSFDDARFAFVEAAILHLRSSFLEELGCRVTDCPGLDASAYDKEVTRRALLRADGVLFVHRCTKMVGASTLGNLFEFVRDTGRTDKTILALNLWGISRNAAVVPGIDRRGRPTPSIVGASEQQIRNDGYGFPVIWCHVLLAYLAALGERKLRSCVPFAIEDRRWLAEKAALQDEGQSDDSLWAAAVDNTNSLFKIPELNGISALDDVAVAAIRKASNFDALIAAVSETVLREKTGSILVDNGSVKALETLRAHEHELKLKKEEAERSEKECAEDVESAKRDLQDFSNEAKELIENSRFQSSQKNDVAALARDLVDETIEGTFLDTLSRHIGKIVCEHNANLEGFSQKGFREAFLSDVIPLIVGCFSDLALKTLQSWDKTPSDSWSNLLANFDDLRKKIKKSAERHFGGKSITEGLPFPTGRPPMAKDMIVKSLMRKRDIFAPVAEKLREGFWHGLWSAFKFIAGGFIIKLLGLGDSEEEKIRKCAERIRPDLEEVFDSAKVRRSLEKGAKSVFDSIHSDTIAALNASRDKYRKDIEDRCNELLELHRLADEEKHKIAKAAGKLCEECIAPLRAEIEAFEKSVKTVQQ